MEVSAGGALSVHEIRLRHSSKRHFAQHGPPLSMASGIEDFVRLAGACGKLASASQITPGLAHRSVLAAVRRPATGRET